MRRCCQGVFRLRSVAGIAEQRPYSKAPYGCLLKQKLTFICAAWILLLQPFAPITPQPALNCRRCAWRQARWRVQKTVQKTVMETAWISCRVFRLCFVGKNETRNQCRGKTRNPCKRTTRQTCTQTGNPCTKTRNPCTVSINKNKKSMHVSMHTNKESMHTNKESMQTNKESMHVTMHKNKKNMHLFHAHKQGIHACFHAHKQESWPETETRIGAGDRETQKKPETTTHKGGGDRDTHKGAGDRDTPRGRRPRHPKGAGDRDTQGGRRPMEPYWALSWVSLMVGGPVGGILNVGGWVGGWGRGRVSALVQNDEHMMLENIPLHLQTIINRCRVAMCACHVQSV